MDAWIIQAHYSNVSEYAYELIRADEEGNDEIGSQAEKPPIE